MQEKILNPQPTTSKIEKQDYGLKDSPLDMVAFQLDQQVYCLPIHIIHQIIDMVAITHLPEANDSIEGIFNFHGNTVPVIDLRKFLNLPKIPVHLHTPIMLVAFSGQTIGLIVDKVLNVVSYPRHAILPPGSLLPEDLGKISILDGLIQNSEGFMMLLNLEQLFSAQRQQDLAETLDHLSIRSQAFSEDQRPINPASASSLGMGSAQDKPEGKRGKGDDEIPQKRNQKQHTKPADHTTARQGSSHENNTAIPREEMA
jgi:purine-binding chemotaxis protein CheW